MTVIQRRIGSGAAVTLMREHILAGTMKVYRENKEVSRSGRRTGAKLPFGKGESDDRGGQTTGRTITVVSGAQA